MRLVHVEGVLEFKGEFVSDSISQQLSKALTGKKAVMEQVVEPVEFRSTKKRQLITWDIDSCRVVIESIDDLEECITKMLAFFNTIDNIAPFGLLSRREFTTYWIYPAEGYSFKSLEQKYRKMFICNHTAWEKASDSSVIVDLKMNGYTLHHQSGAMRTQQLNQEFLEFRLENIPKVFLFLWASVISNKLIQYSEDSMREYLHKSLTMCLNHISLLEDTWKESL